MIDYVAVLQNHVRLRFHDDGIMYNDRMETGPKLIAKCQRVQIMPRFLSRLGAQKQMEKQA